MTHKKTTTLMLLLTTIMIIISSQSLAVSTSASEWTIGNVGISGSVSLIRTYETYAMARAGTNQIALYDGTNWQEIAKPTLAFSTIDTMTFDKANDGNFYWYFDNTSNYYEIHKYNPATTTWTTIDQNQVSGLGASHTQDFACIWHGVNLSCYVVELNTNHYCEMRDAFTGNTVGTPIALTSASCSIIGAKDRITVIAGRQASSATFYSYSWNGVSWNQETSQTGSASGASLYTAREDTLYKASIGSTYNQAISMKVFNQTSGIYQSKYSRGNAGIQASAIMIDTSAETDIYWSDDDDFYSMQYFGNHTHTLWSGTGNSIYTMDADIHQTNMFLGSENGVVYHYKGAVQNPDFHVSTEPTSNPTVYGQTVNFDTTILNTYTTYAYVNITIFDNTGDGFYEWQYQPSNHGGYTATNSISGATWTNFAYPATYQIYTVAYDNVGNTATDNFTWYVTANATTNTTIKNLTEYTTPEDFTQIFALTRINNNRLFAVGNDLNGHYILSYDITNPNSVAVKSKIINETTESFFEPTSISLNDNTLYLGTDNYLFAFTNATYADATKLTQDPTPYGFSSFVDRINDIEATTTGAWMCQQGYFYDEATYYNRTSNSTSTTLTADPCLGILMRGDAMLLRLDTSIKIYNSTTKNLITTITGLTAPSGGARHDLMTINANNLYTLSSTNQVRKYDITTLSSPTYQNKCNTNYETISLEAIYNNTVIIGWESSGTNGLRVCDFADPTKYDASTSTYTSTQLTTLDTTEIPYDIIKMTDNGKFVVALNNKIGIYFYTEQIIQEQTNNPPSIGSISVSPTSPCVNQTSQLTILATDPDTATNLLTYDYDCTGTQAIMQNNYITNLFSCTWTSAGTKTVKAWVSDGLAQVLSTKTITVQNCNLTNYLNFKVLDYDTGALLSGVLINIIGDSSQTTNTAGQASFTVASPNAYSVQFSKSGYITKTTTQTPFNGIYTVYIQATTLATGETRNQLFVNIVDTNGQPIPYASVSVTNPITIIAQNVLADATGLATFVDLATGLDLKISAGKDNYQSTFDRTIMTPAEVKTITIILYAQGEKISQITGRACSDYVNGLVLCSPLNITRTGDYCNTDEDCITGRCELNPSHMCSKFNWTWCDENGYERGNKCFTSAMVEKTGSNSSEFILDNFLYVLAFVAIAIFGLMIIKSIKPN